VSLLKECEVEFKDVGPGFVVGMPEGYCYAYAIMFLACPSGSLLGDQVTCG